MFIARPDDGDVSGDGDDGSDVNGGVDVGSDDGYVTGALYLELLKRKEFVDKDLLMSLWGMKMAHEKETRWIVLGNQRRLDGSGASCG